MEALHGAGVPPEALSLLPGEGEPGAALVDHPGVHVIAFTGSSAVGLEIVERAARTPEGQHHVKRVVAEMGGKNCVIVDSDADLDEVVPAVVASAFGFAGQKCSACSRVLVHEAAAGELVQRLAGRGRGAARGPGGGLRHRGAGGDRARGPRPGGADGRAGGRARADRGPGRATCPTGAGTCTPRWRRTWTRTRPCWPRRCSARCSRWSRWRSVEAACDAVDALPFALTGGLFSRNPDTVRAVTARTPVGNLYVNRGVTGAMVGRQPFGGNRRSGIGSKAGGPDYLLQFAEPRVVTENTMRQGLVVE